MWKKYINNVVLISLSKAAINESIFIKFKQINIEVINFFSDEKKYYFLVRLKDYEKIINTYKYLNFKIVRYYGINNIIRSLKKYKMIFICTFLTILITIFASFFIVDIKIESKNENMVNYLYDELETYGISKFSFRKSFDEINKIKKSIKDQNKDKLDWLEIERKGMQYVIRFEERKKILNEKNPQYCHVYANKEGIIKRLKVFSGTSMVQINSYVKNDDLLISGDIYLNDNVVNKICASGKVYAEVWYNVEVNMPLTYTKDIETGKKRNNIIITIGDKDYVLLKDRLKNYHYKKKLIFSALGINIYLRKDYEIIKKKYKYTEREALKEAIYSAKEKINLTFEENERIVSEKVLQKSINDSTINVEVFIAVEKQIGKQVLVTEEE